MNVGPVSVLVVRLTNPFDLTDKEDPMMDSFRQSLIDYVLSGHAYLHAHTPEKARFVQELKEVAEALPPDGRPVFVWSPADGRASTPSLSCPRS